MLGFTAIAAFLVRLALTSQRGAPVTGVEGLIGEPGVALEPIGPGYRGRVRVHGEIWTAIASERIARGDRVHSDERRRVDVDRPEGSEAQPCLTSHRC